MIPTIFLSLVLILLFMSVKIVPEGMAYTIERFGKYAKTLYAGQHFIIPLMDRVGYRVSMRERKVPIRFNDLKTKDNQEVIADADVFVTITDPRIAAYKSGDIDESLRRNLNKLMISVAKSHTLKSILGNADDIDAQLLALMQAQQDSWGVDVSLVDVHKIYPAP